jgi:hypothetical protein
MCCNISRDARRILDPLADDELGVHVIFKLMPHHSTFQQTYTLDSSSDAVNNYERGINSLHSTRLVLQLFLLLIGENFGQVEGSVEIQ